MSSKIFFTTARTLSEAVNTLSNAIGADSTQKNAERYLRSAKRDYIKSGGRNPGIWDRERIFRVTVEEVKRQQ